MSSPRAVTVLGGGISGLSTVFYLSRRFPAQSGFRIHLVEKASRLGGWVRSERVRMKGPQGSEADIVLESGPRTLRPTSKAILELINLLDLQPSVLTVSRSVPASRNRFLHLQGTEGLVTIPGSIPSLLRSPLAKVIVPAVLRDAVRRADKGSLSSEDESVDAFLSRHFGTDFAQTFGSALVHGIYAADSRLLSVRTAFPTLVQLEGRGRGSVVRGIVNEMLSSLGPARKGQSEGDSYELGGVVELMKGVSVYSFRDGMQTLTDSMVRRLNERPNVEVSVGDGVVKLERSASGDEFDITTESGRRITSSHIVSAMPLPQLHRLSQSSASPPLPQLVSNPSSSVTVVNLVFPPVSTPVHPEGFGYLIPRPSTGYPASSLGMLGTVFDSSALSGQDLDISTGQPSPSLSTRFTKVTVMLGGPYGTPSPHPSTPEFLPMLLEALRRHLGHKSPLPEPCLVRVRHHVDCIPTPTVGHAARMLELARGVKEQLGPNAFVIGAGVGGVSVGDCVESGRRVALELRM